MIMENKFQNGIRNFFIIFIMGLILLSYLPRITMKLQYITINDTLISISKKNIKIYNSYCIRSENDMKNILKYIYQIAAENNITYRRTMQSHIIEWQAHNFLYDYNLFKSHTKDVDLNDNENNIRRCIYFFLSFLYKE